MQASKDSFSSRRTLRIGSAKYQYYSLPAFAEAAGVSLQRLPLALRVVLENLLRHEDGESVTREHLVSVAQWDAKAEPSQEIAFRPARVLLQDFTGVPAVVDLCAMRDAMTELGGDPRKINPSLPSELVIDHSVQVDAFGDARALGLNAKLEFERNRERYQLLRWAQGGFEGFRVVPPATGIVHQVNLEYLARVVFESEGTLYPDTLVGTDSHTTMVNGLGVLGWGVGGIEAEAAMLGQAVSLLLPQVVGVRLQGMISTAATATDLVLTVTERLRQVGVVGRFVEFFGPGLSALTLADRATLANMSPEFGSTCALFPIDEQTLAYMRLSGRPSSQVARVEAYARAQQLMAESVAGAEYSQVVEIDLSQVVPSIAGPKRPQDRISLSDARGAWRQVLSERKPGASTGGADSGRAASALADGSVVIAAITSCTNTSNPSVMVAAGLLARAARVRGLEVKPWVKTSLAPGSQVVTDYLRDSGLLEDLEYLRFFVVGYGCTTCIGNSGPLPEEVATAIGAGDLVVAGVLSGNRNFEGRIHPSVVANYLASPPLVVAYALAGTVDIDFEKQPLGQDSQGKPVYLRELWPKPEDVSAVVHKCVTPDLFQKRYADVFAGTGPWQALPPPSADRFEWEPDSTYVRRPRFFDNLASQPAPLQDIRSARVLLLLGDSVTTDHISPAGAIAPDGPAADYLREHGVAQKDFNSFGSRRGNHEVMVRGTFANVRLRNRLAPGTEGGLTQLVPSGQQTSVFAASEHYANSGTPLLVLAGKDYGTGSSRDWAAKGTAMLGVRAVIAESFERIHRSNLVGMGVLPLQFVDCNVQSLGLSGREAYAIAGIAAGLSPGKELRVVATAENGKRIEFSVCVRIDTAGELEFYRHGGILQFVLRRLVEAPAG